MGTLEKTIHLQAEDRFVPADVLRRAYRGYEDSLNPSALRYVPLPDGRELGIVASDEPAVARAISSILSRSLDDARNDRGGHLPVAVVQRVQREIISPWGIAHLWGVDGHRFVLSRAAGDGRREIVASILVGKSKDDIFFFTGRYNNLKHSTIAADVDLTQAAGFDPTQRWFDQFAFPPLDRIKPRAYHHIANFVVAKEQRGRGFSRLLLDAIVQYYARDAMLAGGRSILHAQYLLCGRGFWQIGDPPWLPRMRRLGFHLRGGAESFFIEHDWAPLPPIYDGTRTIGNVAYNASFGLPDLYRDFQPARDAGEHLLERIPEVVALATDPRAKLQYFQTLFPFVTEEASSEPT